jgi:hypothetical protein
MKTETRCASEWREDGRSIQCARQASHGGMHFNTREQRQWDATNVDCSCCGTNFYRTPDGDCTYCRGAAQVCCRN